MIGKWTCYGSFVGNGGATAEGVWLYSTQVYEFDVEQIAPNVFAPGADALVSIGPERNDLDVPWHRAVSGGYGEFAGATGVVQQTKIGFNQTDRELHLRLRHRRLPLRLGRWQVAAACQACPSGWTAPLSISMVHATPTDLPGVREAK